MPEMQLEHKETNAHTQEKTLKVTFKAIFTVHFASLVSKECFSYNVLTVIFLLYE